MKNDNTSHTIMYEPVTRGLLRTIPGRSSDLSIHTVFRLPGNYPPVTFTTIAACGKTAPLLQRRVRAGLTPASLFTQSELYKSIQKCVSISHRLM